MLRSIGTSLVFWWLFISGIAVGTAVYFYQSRPPVSGQYGPSYPITRHVQYGFSLQNSGSGLLKSARLWVCGPVQKSGAQLFDRFETSHPYELITDQAGNQILCFTFSDLPPYAVRLIRIRARLFLSGRFNPVSLENRPVFLQAADRIESCHPEIIKAAERLRSTSIRRTAARIFDYVTAHIKRAGYTRRGRGALYTLRRQTGDCTEMMYLFTALCRALNIPARGMGGYVCLENMRLKPSAYHNWAEFYDGGTWKIADPFYKRFEQPDGYIAMKCFGGRSTHSGFDRFRFEGKGLQVKMTS